MKNLSPSKKGISSGQVGKLKDMLEHGINKSTVFQNTLTAEVDRFVKKVGPDLRDAWVELLKRRFQDFIDIFRIPVDYDEYDESEAIARAIEAAEFDEKYVRLASVQIPLVGTGRVVREVHEVHFGRVMYNRDLPNALKERGEELGFKNGFKFADPLTALRFAGTNPNQQRKYPLAILFTDHACQLWSLCLHGHSGGRHLNICRSGPDDNWHGLVRFLAVCELPSVA